MYNKSEIIPKCQQGMHSSCTDIALLYNYYYCIVIYTLLYKNNGIDTAII